MTHFSQKFLAAGLLSFAMLAGCGSSQSSTDGNGYTRTSDGAVVQVTLDEFHIHMPTTIPSGNIDFHIQNTGKMGHNLKISGNGMSKELDQTLGAGNSADLTMSLTPGTYKVICPILTHADMGMRLDLTVQ